MRCGVVLSLNNMKLTGKQIRFIKIYGSCGFVSLCFLLFPMGVQATFLDYCLYLLTVLSPFMVAEYLMIKEKKQYG